jgi:hypothetical protein
MVNASNQYEHTNPRLAQEPTESLSTLRRQNRQQTTLRQKAAKYVNVSINRN